MPATEHKVHVDFDGSYWYWWCSAPRCVQTTTNAFDARSEAQEAAQEHLEAIQRVRDSIRETGFPGAS